MNTKHESAQFLIAIYELCLSAELAQLRIEIYSRSGEHEIGVPTVLENPNFDWPGDGSQVMIEIDAKPIVLDHIQTCTIFAPAHREAALEAPADRARHLDD